MEQAIPGTIPVRFREVRYVADDGEDHFVDNGLFLKVLEAIDPPIPTSGGAITENVRLRLPTGELFHGLSYKADVEGWRAQVEGGAARLGLAVGEIVEGSIAISDGRCYPLSECDVTFF